MTFAHLNELKETTFRQLQCIIDREEEKHCVLSVNRNGFVHYLLTAINYLWQVSLSVTENTTVLHSISIIDELLVRMIVIPYSLSMDCSSKIQ
jgi:hypothetical protein